MKQFMTILTAVILCTVLFFILQPLASDNSFEQEIEQLELPEATEQVVEAEPANGKFVDKIAEFPILPEQREKLQMLQRERQESIRGMEPARIEIPSIGVSANIQPTGILENGEMGVPDDVDEVGWFEPGYLTGSRGHSVLAGHVDSLTGPAVFYDLDQVRIGETITVTDVDGREMVFEVTEIASYETDQAPIREIFGPSDKRMLNVITCTGVFNRNIGSHEERLVVSAELVSDSQVSETMPDPPAEVTATSFNVSWHAVRDDAIIGYRVYEQDPETGEMTKIETVSLFDRKNVSISATEGKRYYVSSVDVDLNESEKELAKQ